ncbi:MAG: dihydroorotase [Clostridia bacterium]|nr:dihydroorotase [Clostridia bacterium]
MLLKGGRVYDHGQLLPMDVDIVDGRVVARGKALSAESADRVVDVAGLVLFPGFVDVHVHLREPGFSYKETIATGTRAAARGGYTAVCAMPNLNPPPDCDAHLAQQEQLIREGACIRVLPYGTITVGQTGVGEVIDMAVLAGRVAGFSDDGRGVRDEATMRLAMEKCKAADSILAAHCEDMSLIPPGGAIHAGSFAAAHGIPGIPSESEWRPIERDLRLAAETGCRYHVCHVSCRESVALIRRAKAAGIDVTCETGPHYLLMCQDDLKDEGRFKMNPPLRDRADMDALLEGLLDGTIDMIATDHAPHSAEEKAKGLAKSAMGVVGIETAFPLLYTHLVETGRMTLETLIDRMAYAPRARFRLDGGLNVGDRAEITAFDLHADEVIDPADFLSMGKATPFEGWRVHAACRMTLLGEEIVYGGEC